MTNSNLTSFKSAINQSEAREDNLNFAGIKRNPIKHLSGRERTVFLHFLVQCNHADNPNFYFDGKLLPLKRGDWVTSLKTIADLSGLKVRPVRTALKNLSNMTNLQTKSIANRATLLSLENIDLYLLSKNELPNKSTSSKTKKRQTTDNQTAINNNDDKDDNDSKNENTKYDDFHLFVASQLAGHIKTKKLIAVNDTQIKSWAGEIAMLEKKDLQGRQSTFDDIQKGLEAIKQYDGEQFFPVIESGKSFRQKFSKIESFLQRNNPKSKTQQAFEAFLAEDENGAN